MEENNNYPTKSDRDITILLLGETGVGKSTWINGFANFIRHETLEEAEKDETLCIIPSSFTMTDENYEERVIATGSDVNEVTDVGQSATQHPQSYTFPKDNYIIRLIDTPGIGDVRGVEQDKKNFQLILDHISHLDDLHAICILLKPNNARLNIMFSFCIKELLTHLHKDASRNIVFCFTNSRSTFYRPGDTLPALRKLLNENKDVDIPLNQSTLYCMDNESIRFLYALKDNIKFTPEERMNYNASWDKSVAEVTRLLQHASGLRPHSIQYTISLNSARQTILALRTPMAEIARNIQMNIASSENKRLELTTSKESKDELSKSLFHEEVDVRMESLESPRTICTNDKCVDIIQVGPEKKTNYKSQCHNNCSTGKHKHYKFANIVGHKSIKKCSAFDSKGNCKHCQCSWMYHMKITYETFTECTKVLDVGTEAEISEKETAIMKIERFLARLDERLEELREEEKEITNTSAKFACFLKKNAITPYNDALIAYLSHFISEEEKKIGQGGDRKVLEGMEQMKDNYEEQMRILQEAIEDGTTDDRVTADDLNKYINNLYELKHSGQKLKKMMNESLHSVAASYTEKRIESSGSFRITTTKKPKPVKSKSKLSGTVVDIFKKVRQDLSSGNKAKRDGSFDRNASYKVNIGNATKRSTAIEPVPPQLPKNRSSQISNKPIIVQTMPKTPLPPRPTVPPRQHLQQPLKTEPIPEQELPKSTAAEIEVIEEITPTPNNVPEPRQRMPETVAVMPETVVVKPETVVVKPETGAVMPETEVVMPETEVVMPQAGGAAPPPPPLPLPPSHVFQKPMPASLLDQIANAKLKKREPGAQSGPSNQKKGGNEGKLNPGASMDDMMTSLKQVLLQRGMRVQDTFDDVGDVDEANGDFSDDD